MLNKAGGMRQTRDTLSPNLGIGCSLARRGSVLVQGMVGSVTCVAAHPKLPRLVILCDSGDVHLWDYNLKVRSTSPEDLILAAGNACRWHLGGAGLIPDLPTTKRFDEEPRHVCSGGAAMTS